MIMMMMMMMMIFVVITHNCVSIIMSLPPFPPLFPPPPICSSNYNYYSLYHAPSPFPLPFFPLQQVVVNSWLRGNQDLLVKQAEKRLELCLLEARRVFHAYLSSQHCDPQTAITNKVMKRNRRNLSARPFSYQSSFPFLLLTTMFICSAVHVFIYSSIYLLTSVYTTTSVFLHLSFVLTLVLLLTILTII